MRSGTCYEDTIARVRGLDSVFGFGSWGSATLHPRLYAVARIRGLGANLVMPFELHAVRARCLVGRDC